MSACVGLLQYTWSRDTRDSRVLPSSGYLLKAVHVTSCLSLTVVRNFEPVHIRIVTEFEFECFPTSFPHPNPTGVQKQFFGRIRIWFCIKKQ